MNYYGVPVTLQVVSTFAQENVPKQNSIPFVQQCEKRNRDDFVTMRVTLFESNDTFSQLQIRKHLSPVKFRSRQMFNKIILRPGVLLEWTDVIYQVRKKAFHFDFEAALLLVKVPYFSYHYLNVNTLKYDSPCNGFKKLIIDAFTMIDFLNFPAVLDQIKIDFYIFQVNCAILASVKC